MKNYLFGVVLLACLPFISCNENDSPSSPTEPTEVVDPPEEEMVEVAEVDNVVRDFMTRYEVPGAAVAITRNGKLIYSKGYGFSDRENQTYVDTTSRFRIASLSKAITAIAIMKLVEEEKLRLDQKVFGEGAVLGTTYGTPPYDDRLTDVTIKHLLEHTAGGWKNDSNDPMFTNETMTADELISWTIDQRSLENEPGTTYAYSNFGYSILGRVIERVSGDTYEDYVNTTILAPIGVDDMELGGNTLADRKNNEVKYYGQNGGNPYIYNIERMDAHGGWIASANDLMRLLVHVDGFSNVPDILSPQSIALMTTPSTANENYAFGWMVNSSNNWWHTGSLPGTATEMVRTADGFNWVVLTNTRSPQPNFGSELDQLIWKAINNSNTTWPTEDLF